jgi:hypothetical protein
MLIGLQLLADLRHYEVTVKFDKPVNVSKFDWPIARQRVRATVDVNGVSLAHTSDGDPHLRIRRALRKFRFRIVIAVHRHLPI